MGGGETVDSNGNVWLGDGPGAGDPLDIRPDDGGGTNTIENWSLGVLVPESLTALGFDPLHPGDRYIFNTIRWDNGGDAVDFQLEIPVPDGDYTVSLYFNEACCTGRHFKLEVEGRIVDEDVSFVDYAPEAPALGSVGRLSFPDIRVSGGLLRIALRPCPACPGANDGNAILAALEILPDLNCDSLGLDCSYDVGSNRVTCSWSALTGADLYRVLKNGSEWLDLPPSVTSFTDADPRRQGTTVIYALEALGGGERITLCSQTVVTRACPGGLRCQFEPLTEKVILLWEKGFGLDLIGYQVRANGFLVATLPGDATAFEEVPAARLVTYEILPFSAPAGQCVALSGALTTRPAFVRGDADADSRINLTDAILLLGHLFGGGPGQIAPACPDAADSDDSGALDLSDAVFILNWLFLTGEPPRRPSPSATAYVRADCGVDLEVESPDLGCPRAGARCR